MFRAASAISGPVMFAALPRSSFRAVALTPFRAAVSFACSMWDRMFAAWTRSALARAV
jgi:hypothetical protein